MNLEEMVANGFPPIEVELTEKDIERLKMVPQDLRQHAIRVITEYRLKEMHVWRSLCSPNNS